MMQTAVIALAFPVLLMNCGRVEYEDVAQFGERQPDQISFEAKMDDGKNYTAYLISYTSDDLKVYAMVAVPKSPAPATGFPIVVANHGYVNDPQRYGISGDGRNARPGDYYRSVPELYSEHGFVVLIPDYRGHGSSEGYEQIKDQSRGDLARYVDKYANDVVILLSALDEIENADVDKVYMWSHSMGGGVALRVLARTEIVKASSFWSTMSVDDVADQIELVTGPVVIHHAVEDQSTAYSNSVRLAAALEETGREYVFYSYEGSDHFFIGEARKIAADRDAEYFLSH